ncbi:MAG: hypothetical protein ACK5L2_03305, partial [Planctomyces sp.]
PTSSAQPFLACGVLSEFECRHVLCCTPERLRRECAGAAGRSRRPRHWCVSGAGSTRIHQTGMVQPAAEASKGEQVRRRMPDGTRASPR